MPHQKMLVVESRGDPNIVAQGYEIAGPHEEEYLSSPGMGNIPPEEYQTIIRYAVKKKE